ncbi:MAG: DKNYY domain-containing protein [Myxococcales bacterium]|nr:DKNYY domain-containing protein [Myxococcales bacterium]
MSYFFWDEIRQAGHRQLKGSSYYQDKNNIFHHFEMAHGGRLDVVSKVDRLSFRVINDCYARDKDAIYTDRSAKVHGADLDSFHTSEGIEGCYAKDSKGYFFWDERISPNDKLDEPAKRAIEQLGSN